MPSPSASTFHSSAQPGPLGDLAAKIRARSLTVGIIGLGYVGLPLAGAFHRTVNGDGVRVLGFDIDPRKIDALATGTPYLKHLGDGLWHELRDSTRFEATTDFARLSECDAILICVPTPLGSHREPDLSYVSNTTDAIAAAFRASRAAHSPSRGVLVCLESTTYPGTTRDLVLPTMLASGLTLGHDLALAFSPEREDPGNRTHTTATIPKLVGGVDELSGTLACALYQLACAHVVPCPSAEVAESAKLLENIYRAVNIALVNEMKTVLDAMGIDVWAVIDAASTKPFGFQRFEPGPGLGGHCIPIDPFYMTWRAREVGAATRFIELAGEINTAMPGRVVQKTTDALNARGVPVKGAQVLVLGLAYKPNIDDVRESPALELITHLRDLGAEVSYHDPHVPATHKMRHYDLGMTSVSLDADVLSSADCVLIATAHNAIDWALVGAHARLIVDTRGVMRRVPEVKAAVVQA